MPHSFWNKKKIAGVVLFGVAYLGLWEVTAWLGVPVVRGAAAAKYIPTPPDGRALERSSCEVSAVAPFVVKANYDWVGGPLLGAAATVHYLWLGKWTKEIWHSAVRVL